jgi:cytochrome c oxidase subunit 2
MNLFNFPFISFVSCDHPEPWQLGFQDPATPVMEGIVRLHNDIMFVLTVIGVFCSWILFRAAQLFDESQTSTPTPITHGTTIEIA